MKTLVFELVFRSVPSKETLIKVAFGVAWMTAASQISIPLPFTAVPITLGPNAAVFLGMMLGPRHAAAALVSYVMMGFMGAPIFAGFGAFVGPCAGYLIGYIPSAMCMGWLMQRLTPTGFNTFWAALFSHIPLYVLGMAWLTPYVGVSNVLAMGLIPFLPGLVVKTGILSVFAAKLRNLFQK